MPTGLDVFAAAIVTGGASFAGATLAQYLSHHFTMKREVAVVLRNKRNYIQHITFDIVLAVANLEEILVGAGILNEGKIYKWNGAGSMPSDHINLIDRLDIDLSVSPQFILNSRKFFSGYRHYESIWNHTEKGFELQPFHLIATIELYIQGLCYIVGSLRSTKKSLMFNRRPVPLTDPSYAEIVEAYKIITFDTPRETVFNAANIIRTEFRKSMMPRG